VKCAEIETLSAKNDILKRSREDLLCIYRRKLVNRVRSWLSTSVRPLRVDESWSEYVRTVDQTTFSTAMESLSVDPPPALDCLQLLSSHVAVQSGNDIAHGIDLEVFREQARQAVLSAAVSDRAAEWMDLYRLALAVPGYLLLVI
jgi:hypothetical protein